MPQYNRRMGNKSPQPLRPDTNQVEFNSRQTLVMGLFLTSLMTAGKGIYCAQVRNGGAIRIRIYDGDESYEDTLFPSDDFAYLLAEYAKQFDVRGVFEGLLARANAAPPQSPSAAPELSPEGEDTAPPRSKRLRPS